MNVAVKHNGTTITGFLIRYEREHRICTGIGTLDIVLDGTIPRTFDPWDTIDIHENGDFKVRYYVSNIRNSVPEGTITLECQDKSKQLVDYFIPDSYTIDYPSHTRFWIEKFLDEADINYDFETSSQGPLLSNYTALGLAPAYDQIMMLMQLSGWYFYFDGNGTAIIGPLSTNLAENSGTLNKDDILQIARVTDDKMLRNRAVVWGAFDPILNQYAFADVSTHTRWNYDHRDLRTMVISNQNVPNKSSAISIANVLLKEFAKATIEKHITAHGARSFDLGDAVRVNSDVWRGVGLVTTFGVSLGRDGLVTNVILDERCPRLLGFFNFGDYVYVGTFGDGVWRKHIQFDPAWYNFSTGLTDLNITDLHINNGVFGAIGHSGGMFYNNSTDGAWNPITVTGLMSSLQSVVTESGLMSDGSFSGIMGRATIIDKLTNNVKFGVDNWSGLNYGDYFLSYSGWVGAISGVVVGSGTTASGDSRGWILEYDPVTGQLVGGLGSGIYPISVSGNYDIRVLDLENDGLNDYVSVRTGGAAITGNDELQEYNYGYGGITEYDENSKVSLSNIEDNPSSIGTILTSSAFNILSIGMVDNVDEHELFYTREILSPIFGLTIKKYDTTSSVFSQTSSTTVSLSSGTVPIAMAFFTTYHSQIIKVGKNIYRFLAVQGADVVIVTVTHDGSESYSVTYNNIDVADSTTGPRLSVVQNNDKALIIYGKTSTTDPAFYDNTRWFQSVDLTENTATAASLVYSSGGTITNRKDITFVVTAYATGFQTIGWQSEWNFLSPSDRSAYVLGGLDFAVNKGAFHFTTDQTIVLLAEYHRLSRTWSRIRTSHPAGTIRVNYGVHGFSSYSGDNSVWFTQPVINPIFDEITFRVRPSSETGTGWGQLQYATLPVTTWVNIDLGDFAPLSTNFFRQDTVTENIYIFGRHKIDGTTHLLALNPATYSIEMSPIISFSSGSTSNPGGRNVFNVGNLMTMIFENAVNSKGVEMRVYRNLNPPLGDGGRFLILQRENTEFSIIQEATKPLRADISNSSPILSVQDHENTFVSNFVYGQDLTQVIPISLSSLAEVRDYRYTLLETTSSGTIVASDSPITKQVLYVNQSGVFTADAETYSGGFLLMGIAPSGERIETSNYTYPGQFIFVTTSGLNPMFYQRDPGGWIFDTYPGLPDSRATIIRLDDRI